MYSNVISYHLGNINLFHLKEKSYDLPSKRLRRIFSQMLQHLNRQFLVGPSGILQKSPTLKSSLHKVCEFKYTLKKKKRSQRQIPVSGLLPKEFGKKKKKERNPHTSHYCWGPITYIWDTQQHFCFVFWPFSQASKSEARETKRTNLLSCL